MPSFSSSHLSGYLERRQFTVVCRRKAWSLGLSVASLNAVQHRHSFHLKTEEMSNKLGKKKTDKNKLQPCCPQGVPQRWCNMWYVQIPGMNSVMQTTVGHKTWMNNSIFVKHNHYHTHSGRAQMNSCEEGVVASEQCSTKCINNKQQGYRQ